MVTTRDGHRTVESEPGSRQRRGPVMLVTLASAPFHPAATDLAIGAAVEHAADLLVINVVDCPGGRGPHTDPADLPAVAARLRVAIDRAVGAGLHVTSLRVTTPHPRAALVDLAATYRPLLLVLGPDPDRRSFLRLSRRRHRRILRAVEARTACLMWSPDDDDPRLPRRHARRRDFVVRLACRWPNALGKRSAWQHPWGPTGM